MTEKEELEAARQRIIVLEHEVEQLREQHEHNRAAAEVRAKLAQLGAATVLGAPAEHTQLLEQILQTAKHVLRVHAGTLYLVDQNSEELIFEGAVGKRANLPRGTRFPLSESIAGWVVTSGHAMAVADVEQDPQWAQGMGQALGYTPKTMLAMPLLLHDTVIGVLLLMDKEDGTPFSAHDLSTLGHFAQQAAVAIAQSRSFLSLVSLLRALLADQNHQENLDAQATAFLADTEKSVEYQDILKLAKQLGEIARQGDAARRLSLRIAEAIVAYLHSRTHLEDFS